MKPLLTCIIPIALEPANFLRNLEKLVRKLIVLTENSFEIIFIANSKSAYDLKNLTQLNEKIQTHLPELIENKFYFETLPVGTTGKGRAIQKGVSISSGKYILFIDADLPYNLSFLEEALKIIQCSPLIHLVAANRRLPGSRFNVPVPILKIAYNRHRLGWLFNRIIRTLLPIEILDTQAGMKLFSSFFAKQAFEKIVSPGFWFDIELFLSLREHGLEYRSNPVELKLNCEKSTIKIIRHGIDALIGLAKIIYLHHVRGFYRFDAAILFKTKSLQERLFLWARWKWTPYFKIASFLPFEGKIADLGCGYGLMALALKYQSRARILFGMDHDERRIEANNILTKEHSIEGVFFETASINDWIAPQKYDGISLIDVAHYFSFDTQKKIFREIYNGLNDDGVFVFRELNRVKTARSFLNQIHEYIFTALGITKAQELHFRDDKGWEELARIVGFEVESFPCRSLWFNDFLFVCKKD